MPKLLSIVPRVGGCLVAAAALIAPGCSGPGGAGSADRLPVVPDVPISRAPYDTVHVEFKETLDQGFVYVERVGPYNDVREGVRALLDGAQARGIEPAGPLFVQFLEEPQPEPTGVPKRYRVGMPVAEPLPGDGSLAFDVAPATTVVYAVVAGPFGSGRHAYAALRDRMDRWGWVQAGPVKEIYGFPTEPDGEFLTEVQIPWAPGS